MHKLHLQGVQALGCLLLMVSSAVCQTASDFLPPARGGSKTVAEPAAIKVAQDSSLGTKVVSGATTGDAAVHAAGLLREGDAVVAFQAEGGGLGVMASATAPYTATGKNKDLIRLARRAAYVRGHLQAKTKLIEFMNGTSVSAKTIIVSETTTAISPEATSIAGSTKATEAQQESVAGFLRGATIFDVRDSGDSVSVTVYASPRTTKQVRDYGGVLIDAASLAVGLEHVLSEIRQYVVPPVGAQVIHVATTKETAWVGFGSAMMLDADDPRANLAAKQIAIKKADMRANASLLQILLGEEVAIERTLLTAETEHFGNFKQWSDAADPAPTKAAESRRNREEGLRASESFKECQKFITTGALPPGIVSRTYEMDDGWIFVVKVFLPGVSNAAAEAAVQAIPTTPNDPSQPGPSGRTGPDPRKKAPNK